MKMLQAEPGKPRLLSLMLLSLLFFGCAEREGPPIHFIVPTGFTGKVDIIQDTRNGVALPKQGGTLVCVLPATGKLQVSSLKPFNSWHSETAAYADGTVILPRSGTNSISLFGLGGFASGNNQGVSYFVGTEAEAAQHRF